MINLKIPNDIFRNHIHEINEFLVHVTRKNVRRIELTIEFETTSPPTGIEWHGDWYKVIINGKEFTTHSNEYYGMNDKDILDYIDSLD